MISGLVVYMIAGSYNAVLELGLWQSYLLSVGPVFLYVLLCLRASSVTQINVAAIMSSVYAVVMLLVTVGTIINVATSSIYSPDVLFLVCVSSIFVLSGQGLSACRNRG
jgi:chitin synthase